MYRYKKNNLVMENYEKLIKNNIYRFFAVILSLPYHFFILLYTLFTTKQNVISKELIIDELKSNGTYNQIYKSVETELKNKEEFFYSAKLTLDNKNSLEKVVKRRIEEYIFNEYNSNGKKVGFKALYWNNAIEFMRDSKGVIISFILGFLMYPLLFIYNQPYVKYIFERLIMTFFVIIGVTIVVFSILHFSSFDPAKNILGETATQDQIDNFNKVYGLDQPYIVQLFEKIKGIFTFDLGKSFVGSENVVSALSRRFPITLKITFISLVFALVIAIPAGIIAAVKPNSLFDNIFMLIALIGLSIPTFWQGLIFILNFSIRLKWLPATFSQNDLASLIMPSIVLGTSLMASVARMTRSSTLEVINEDYVMTARAKGLSNLKVVVKHAIPNALIPIVTVVGLQFGGLLGGSSVTEKVFNINGLGSFLVDKQYIPDIPVVLGGVIYISVVMSLINLVVDLLYAFLDPRIRTKMRKY